MGTSYDLGHRSATRDHLTKVYEARYSPMMERYEFAEAIRPEWMTADEWDRRRPDFEHEAATYRAVAAAVDHLLDAAAPIWHMGNGEGGAVLALVYEQAVARQLHEPLAAPKRQQRKQRSVDERLAILERDGYRCVYCGARTQLCVDHIVAVAAGGTDDDENLQTLCRPCNTKKGTKPDEIARREITGGGS